MLSLIITSCHRPDMLRQCCVSLQQQSGIADTEVIVVNNGDQNDTATFPADFPHFRFLYEARRGLSRARNRGAREARQHYLVFLDDDVQFPAGFVRKAQAIAASGKYTAFGGTYRAWYPAGKPHWLNDEFGTKTHLRATAGPIVPGKDGFLSGGVWACRKDVFLGLGGFAEQRGMSATIGYGEEDELQLRLHQAGHRIGYIPDWWLYHAVLPHKWRLRWQLRSAWARRRDRAVAPAEGWWPLLLGSMRTLLATLCKIPARLLQCIFVPHYYWQNAVLDLGIPLARRWGDWQRWMRGCQSSDAKD